MAFWDDFFDGFIQGFIGEGGSRGGSPRAPGAPRRERRSPGADGDREALYRSFEEELAAIEDFIDELRAFLELSKKESDEVLFRHCRQAGSFAQRAAAALALKQRGYGHSRRR